LPSQSDDGTPGPWVPEFPGGAGGEEARPVAWRPLRPLWALKVESRSLALPEPAELQPKRRNAWNRDPKTARASRRGHASWGRRWVPCRLGAPDLVERTGRNHLERPSLPNLVERTGRNHLERPSLRGVESDLETPFRAAALSTGGVTRVTGG